MFTTDSEIRDWLRSLGYAVAERPRPSVEAMFLREARQWGLAPNALAALIRDENLSPAEIEAGVADRQPAAPRMAA